MRTSLVLCFLGSGLGVLSLRQPIEEKSGLLTQSETVATFFDQSKIFINVDQFKLSDDEDSDADLDEDDYDSDDENSDDENSDDENSDDDDPSSPGNIAKKPQRLLHLPSEILTCGSSPFTVDAISAAMSAGLEIIQAQGHGRWRNKPREQPHWFNNREGFDFPDCTHGRMFEFPILIGGKVHRGGRTGARAPPGAHRVIFQADDDGGTFCGLITHEDAETRGSFVACE